MGLLDDRRDYSLAKLETFCREVEEISEVQESPGLSIYVTGSYGRLDASPLSDLDLFFIHKNSKTGGKVSKISKTIIDSKLIEIARRQGFPEFSNEGQFLEIHSLDEILRHLGSPNDDYYNYFTARMLLLLESRPICNGEAYSRILQSIVGAYFRDYHDHEQNFRPIFLVNDILRFWKTLCLNYEHKRNRRKVTVDQKNKNHLRNLKLKYSRLLTCFSMIIPLSSLRYAHPKDVMSLINKSPIDRLQYVAYSQAPREQKLQQILEEYNWFLDITGRTDRIDWISNRENREIAFERARGFGSNIYDLLALCSAETDTLRYLTI